MAATEAEEVTPEGMKALAEAATPGPWKVDIDIFRDEDGFEVCIADPTGEMLVTTQTEILNDGSAERFQSVKASQFHADAAYIAAHDPTLLALLWDVVREAESGTDTTLTVALNAVYAHIGYEP